MLGAVLTRAGTHPVEGRAWAGFTATTTRLRSDRWVGMFDPMVSDEVDDTISIGAMKSEAEDSRSLSAAAREGRLRMALFFGQQEDQCCAAGSGGG